MLGFFPFSFQSESYGEDAQVVATVDRTTTFVNEELHVSVKVSGFRGGIQAPKAPSVPSFDIFYSGRSSRFAFINGESSSTTEFSYVVIPKSVGRYVLKPFEITINGKVYETENIEITVQDRQSVSSPIPAPPKRTQTSYRPGGMTAPAAQSTTAPTTNQSPSLGTEDDPNIFLRVFPSKLNVYTNEQVVLTYSLYTNLDTRYEGFEQEPETSGFWIEEFPAEQDIGRDTEVVDGRKYVRADIKKMALFPTAPGEYSVKPGTVKASVQIPERGSSLFDEFFSDSFFSGAGLFARREEKRLTQPPIQIVVKPLPEAGKPANFKGAVGEFKMSTALDKQVVNQNEALTLTVNVEGEGNIETLAAPVMPQMDDVKVYESDTKSQLFRVRNLIAGKKTFEMIMIPSKAGTIEIPPVEFGFFSPRQSKYVVLKSEPMQVEVKPSSTPPPSIPKEVLMGGEGEGKKEIRSEGEDIRYLKEEMGGVEHPLGPILFWLALANGVMTILVIGLAIARKRDQFFAQNVSLKRIYFAKKYARKGLKTLMRLAKSSEHGGKTMEQFYDEAARILNQYLADRLNLSSHGLTEDIVEEGLSRQNATAETLEKIRDCYRVSDQVRFGRMTDVPEDRRAMIERIQAIMEELERL